MANYTFYHFNQLDSTVQYCLRNKDLLSTFSVVSTDQLKAATDHEKIGNYDSGGGLIFSIFLKDEKELSGQQLKTIFFDAIQRAGKSIGISLTIHHDLLYLQSKKIGECTFTFSDTNQILTLFMHINTVHFSQTLKFEATSVYLALDKKTNIKQLKETIVTYFQQAYQKQKQSHLQ